MNQKPHSGQHPDANQLGIFVEGVDTAREREQMLAHLAECQECRDVVFLMQRPVEASPDAREPSREWVWQRWFLPVGFAGAALAGLAALMLYVHPWTRGPESVRQNVALVESDAGARPNVVAPTNDAEQPKNSARSARPATRSARQESEASADSKARNAVSSRASPGAATQETQSGAPSVSVLTTTEAGTAPQPNVQSELNSPVIEDLPLTGRNIASVQPLGTPPRAPAATPRDRSEKQQNLPELLVERPSGPETVSGVSGRVTDQSGAVIAGATVALRDASGGTRQIATEADGSFRLTGIPSGHYDLTVTSPGFKSNQQSIDLKPSELAMVQPVLAVGEVTQTVEVAASAPMLETDSARVVSFPAKLPSRLQVASSASIGKRMLSLDGAGTLFLSRNTGKSWKKVHPQWTGKAVRVDVTAAQPDEAKNKIEASGAESAQSVFRLTTDSGSQWTSKDGTHWHPQ